MRPATRCPCSFFGIDSSLIFPTRVLGMSEKISYWFNQKTRQVESGPQSLSLDRLGPFDTFEEAARAEQIIAERARKLREENEEEN